MSPTMVHGQATVYLPETLKLRGRPLIPERGGVLGCPLSWALLTINTTQA